MLDPGEVGDTPFSKLLLPFAEEGESRRYKDTGIWTTLRESRENGTRWKEISAKQRKLLFFPFPPRRTCNV